MAFFRSLFSANSYVELSPELTSLLASADHVLVLDSCFSKQQLSAHQCQVMGVPGSFLPKAMGMALPLKSSLLRLFNYHLAKMMQSGILDRIKRDTLKQL